MTAFGGIPNIASAGVAIIPNVNPAQFARLTQTQLAGPLTAIGTAAGIGIGAAFAGAIGTAVAASDAFVPFEESLTRITTLVGISTDEVERLGQAALDLAPEVGRGPQELADALFFITSAGLRGETALEALDAAAKAAALGLGETEVVADAATSAMNAYGSENLSAADAVGVLVKSVEQGKLEADSLAGAIGRVIPLASEAGVSFNEIGAALAAVSRTGLEAEEGATALRGILATIVRPTQQARDALAEYGLSTEDLRRTIDNQGLLGLLELLRSSVGDNTEALATIIPNIRALTGFLSLTGSQADTTARIFRELGDVTGLLDERFADVQDSQAFRRQQAEAARTAVLIGEGSDAAEQLTRFLEQVPGILEDIIPLLTELGGGLLGLGADAASGVGEVVDFLGDILDSTPPVVEAIAGIGAAALALKANPVIAGLALVAAGIIGIGQNAQTAKAQVEALGDVLDGSLDFDSLENADLQVLQELFDDQTGLGAITRLAGDSEPVLRKYGISLQEVLDVARSGDRINTLNAFSAFDVQGTSLFDAATIARFVDDIRRAVLEYEAQVRATEDANVQYAVSTQAALDDIDDKNIAALNQGLEDQEEAADNAASALDASLIPALSDLEQSLVDALEAQLNLNEQLDNFSDPVTDTIDTLTDINDLLGEIADGEGTDQTFIDLGQAMTDLDENIDVLQTTGARSFDAFIAEIDRAGGDGIAILEGFGFQFNEQGRLIGIELANGIVVGLDGLGEQLAAKASREISGALATTGTRFGVSSPSTVFRDELGIPFGEGVVAGFAAALGGDPFTDAIRRAASDANPAGGNVAGLGAAGAGTVVNIYNPREESVGASVQLNAAVIRTVLQ